MGKEAQHILQRRTLHNTAQDCTVHTQHCTLCTVHSFAAFPASLGSLCAGQADTLCGKPHSSSPVRTLPQKQAFSLTALYPYHTRRYRAKHPCAGPAPPSPGAQPHSLRTTGPPLQPPALPSYLVNGLICSGMLFPALPALSTYLWHSPTVPYSQLHSPAPSCTPLDNLT